MVAAMTSDRIGWGIVGCGWVSRDFAVPAIAASRNGRLLALCDPDPAALHAIAPEARDVARSTAIEQFLRTPGLQAVYVAAPNHAHRPLVEAAAAAGKPVLCEKPMATMTADAEAMVAACARAGVFYATAFDQRFHPAHRKAAELLRAGAVGRVAAIRIVYACWVGAAWSADNWRIDPARAGGGAFFDLAPHGLDLVAMLLGEPLEEAAILGQRRVHAYAQAPGGVDDGAMVVASTRCGVLAQLHVAYNCPECLPRRRLEIVGDGGQLTLLDTMGQTPGGSLTLTTAAGTREIAVEGIERSPFALQVEAFADHLLGRQPFGFEPQGDLRTMTLLSRLRDAIADHGAR